LCTGVAPPEIVKGGFFGGPGVLHKGVHTCPGHGQAFQIYKTFYSVEVIVATTARVHSFRNAMHPVPCTEKNHSRNSLSNKEN